LLSALAVQAILAACSTGPGAPQETAIVVGIQSEPLAGALNAMVVSNTVGTRTDSFGFSASDLPLERKVVAPSGDPSAALRVEVDGYPGAAGATMPLLVRTAETHFVPGKTMLLRMMLQGGCLLGLPGGPPGGPMCTAPQTCINRACASDLVAPQSLEPYAPGWETNVPDICKPLDAGPPVVQVGTGQTDYLPLVTGQTVQMEAGPQGGHHIWIATRQENLKQAGTTTTITSTQPGTGIVGPRMSFVFDFEQDQGGFCKLYGLRYQVDVDGADYHQFLGKPLDVTVTLKDTTGTIGVGHATVNIDPTLLCPPGATSC
jgi:hypothetical protein